MLSRIEASIPVNQRIKLNQLKSWIHRVYKTTSIWENVFAVAILIFIVYFSLRILVYSPYFGFSLGKDDNIASIFVPQKTYPHLEIGDRLIQINQEKGINFYSYLNILNFNNVKVGDLIKLEVIRDQNPMTIDWHVPGFSAYEFLDRVFYLLIPFTFWVFGMLTAFMVRPKNTRSRYLVAFFYITAIWIVAGAASSYLVPYASKIFNIALWFTIPIYFLLHWDLTRSVSTLNKNIIYGLYFVIIVVCILDLAGLLPPLSSFAGAIIGFMGSIYLLIQYLLFHKGTDENLIKLLTLLLIFCTTPSLITGLLYILNIPTGNTGSAIFTLIFIPITYFLIISHSQPDSLQLRSNRTIILIIYGFIIFSLSTSVVLFTQAVFRFSNINLIMLVILVGMISSLSIVIYPWFQRLIDQRFFGIKFPPETMIEHFTTRITTSLDSDRLIGVLRNAVFPSLMIREALIYRTPGMEIKGNPTEFTPLLVYGLPPTNIPSHEEIISITERVRSGGSRTGKHSAKIITPAWVKLVLPLWVDRQLVGISLFGRRDPDDFYSDLEINTLKTIMNHTALALVNIDQAKQLHALYQNDMERQEKERTHLARELHDNVLSKMALFAHTNKNEENDSNFADILESSVSEIREIIHNLRPSMLNFGLMPAINELVDELITTNGFHRSDTSINLDINYSRCRFPQDVELHIYRIVQEACLNALTHSACEGLCVKGDINRNLVDLTISDNGTGFDTGGHVDLQNMLAHKRYGLAGMFERAYLINAHFAIDSIPGRGTEVHVVWAADRIRNTLTNE